LLDECGTDPESGAVLYATSALFLEHMGLQDLSELPDLAPLLPGIDELGDSMPAEHAAGPAAAEDSGGERARPPPEVAIGGRRGQPARQRRTDRRGPRGGRRPHSLALRNPDRSDGRSRTRRRGAGYRAGGTHVRHRE